MRHIVSLSGGTASAVAADRVISRYGRDATTLWFADTRWEDEDLYRFLADLEAYWEIEIVRYKDGRTPLEVAEDASIIPNQRRAPCALQLKVLPFRAYIQTHPMPLTVHLGLDALEQHRAERPRAEYEAIPGVGVDLPLLWNPVAFPPHHRETERWGIETPRMYRVGFPHNNCGGRCVKQGIGDWNRLRQWDYGRFVEVRDWEKEQRAKGGARADYAIVRDQSGGKVTPVPLADLEQSFGAVDQPGLFPSDEDNFSCFCSY
tara:strand:- start:24967 stop:25749 length:783 start_codon:yes stop_codon:yes gene_type:complete